LHATSADKYGETAPYKRSFYELGVDEIVTYLKSCTLVGVLPASIAVSIGTSVEDMTCYPIELREGSDTVVVDVWCETEETEVE